MPNMAVRNARVGRPREQQELVNLVRRDVHQDAAKLSGLEKPCGPDCGVQAVRPHAQRLHRLANGSCPDQIQCMLHRRHQMALGEADGKDTSCFGDGCPHLLQLHEAGYARLIR